MNYEFPQKNHWRNRVWNQLSVRVKEHPRDAVVLYLASEQDLDRRTAVKKGFCEHNLIAVDRDASAVDALREKGVLAIHGDLFDVMKAWPKHISVAAVIADFTCGLEEKFLDAFSDAMMTRQMLNAIFVVNLLRGRDASSNAFRQIWGKGKKTSRPQALFEQSLVCEKMLQYHYREKERFSELFRRCFDEADPVYGSYKSSVGALYFDWGIWNNPFGALPDSFISETATVGERLSRSISAILAHRTRRLAA